MLNAVTETERKAYYGALAICYLAWNSPGGLDGEKLNRDLVAMFERIMREHRDEATRSKACAKSGERISAAIKKAGLPPWIGLTI